jgi:hypothetical protein
VDTENKKSLEVFVSRYLSGWSVSCPAISMFVKTSSLDELEERVRGCVELFFGEVSRENDPVKILRALGWSVAPSGRAYPPKVRRFVVECVIPEVENDLESE